ncbi:hypothetical protein F5Y15DRAFT_403210 [Xylariaceae sp. FL0016]|nr:hypothetical protein F5Y15DRAFT_403210 [Xylariaceae sp. FL0016]
MSAPRALRPLLGAGSRLSLLDPLVSSSPARASVKLASRQAASAPAPSICLQCRYSFAINRQQLRPYSDLKQPPNLSKQDSKEKGDPSSLDAARSSDYDPIASDLARFSHLNPERQSPPTPSQAESDVQSQTPEIPSQSPESDLTAQHVKSNESSTAEPDPNLPSSENSRRSALNHDLSTFMDRAQSSLFAASQRINDLTGYSGIETLKSQISHLEQALGTAQNNLLETRSAYKAAVASRSATQREVNTLLARQKTWTSLDFERFTSLYRQDHELDALVASKAQELEHAERDAERLSRELSSGILARYHEEQIWSDKIRRMSTWGTWGLMGVNVLLFLLLQFGAEPWRRRRLVRGFEDKVREAINAERETMERKWAEISNELKGYSAPDTATKAVEVATPASVEEPEKVFEEVQRAPPASWRKVLGNPSRWKPALADLFSERKVAIPMRDVSLVALEGMAAGAAITGSIAFYLIRKA